MKWWCFLCLGLLVASVHCGDGDKEQEEDTGGQGLGQYVSDNGGVLVNSSRELNGKYKVEVKYDAPCSSWKLPENSNCSDQYFICNFIVAPFGRSWEIIGGTKKCDLISPSNGENNDTTAKEDNESTTFKSEVFGLVHEIQLNDETASSGEQFVAVRREPGYVWCADCPTDINPQASGVAELGSQALQHLNRHHPDMIHTLTSRGVIRVQRQAQIVNGVRYIVLVEVQAVPNKNNENCQENCEAPVPEIKLCQITFLEKSWVKLRNGNKFRAVLYNNCTEEYSFGDNGEPLHGNADISDEREDNIHKVQSFNVDATQQRDPLTPERIKDVEDQIITTSVYEKESVKEKEINADTMQVQEVIPGFDNVYNNENQNGFRNTYTENQVPNLDRGENLENIDQNNIQKVVSINDADKTTESGNSVYKVLDDEKKQALEMFLNFYGFDLVQHHQQPNVEANGYGQSSLSESNYPSDNAQVYLKRRKRDISNTKGDEQKFVKDLADFVVQTVDMYDDDDRKRVVLKVDSFNKIKNSELSTGYFIKALVAFTDCREKSKGNECGNVYSNSNVKICDIQVDVKTNGEKTITGSRCHNQKRTRSLKHAEKNTIDQPNSNSKLIQIVQKGLRKYESGVCSDNFFELLNILWATRDIKEETLWNVVFTVQETQCCVGENCNELTNDSPQVCEMSAYENATQSIHVTHIECMQLAITIDENKKKDLKYTPSVVNVALDNIDINDEHRNDVIDLPIDHPDVVELTEKSLRQYEINTCSAHKHEIVKTVKASLNNINGQVINLIFTIKKSDRCRDEERDFEFGKFNTKRGTKTCKAKFVVSDNSITIDCYTVDKNSWQNLPVDDPNVIFLAQRSLEQFDEDTGYRHNLRNIELAKSNSHLTKLTFSIVKNNCPFEDSQDCENIVVYECNTLVSQKVGFLATINIQNYCLDISKKKNLKDNLDVKTKFEDFTQKFKKQYDMDMEYAYRLQVFAANLEVIDNLNANEQGTAVYGVTKFTDLPYYEFRKKYTGLLNTGRNENSIGLPPADIPDIKDLPTEFDWRTKGAVTEVKDQGQCGSCWAFSVTGNIEGLYKIKSDNLLSLSEQELVDCDKMDEGCNGGELDNAYTAIEKLGGLELEQDYPYNAHDGSCHFNSSEVRVQITGAVKISEDEVEMQKWLYQNGPMAIGINANAMQFYYGGVSHPFKFLCSPDNLDHGVLIVGWGIHRYPLFNRLMPYWIIKNSWGPGWGEQGYYRVYRGEGTCGLNKSVTSAVL